MTPLYLLIADVAAVVLICPVAGVVLQSSRRIAIRSLAGIAAWTLASAALMLRFGIDARSVLEAHAVLATTAVAAAGIGRMSRAVFADPLDATAAALCVCVALSCGIFAIGPLVGKLPTEVLNGTLAANPVVAIASAANIDIFRSELLYRTSPIPHQLFAYPEWRLSAGLFTMVGALCTGLAGLAARRRT